MKQVHLQNSLCLQKTKNKNKKNLIFSKCRPIKRKISAWQWYTKKSAKTNKQTKNMIIAAEASGETKSTLNHKMRKTISVRVLGGKQ